MSELAKCLLSLEEFIGQVAQVLSGKAPAKELETIYNRMTNSVAMTRPEELRPMSEAPRDGTPILAYPALGSRWTWEYPAVIKRSKYEPRWYIHGNNWMLKDEDFIGWLPLPTAKLPERKG